MVNQLTTILKENQRGMVTGGIIGGVLYFVSKNVPVLEFSTLQSGLTPTGLVDQLGVTLEIKTLLFFIVLGVFVGLIIDIVIKKK